MRFGILRWALALSVVAAGAGTFAVADDVATSAECGEYGCPPSVTTYTGDTSADYHDQATLSATLAESGGAPIAGKTIDFTIGSTGCSDTTDATGVASCTVTMVDAPGGYQVTATFAGDGEYEGSSDSKPFTVTKEETGLEYTGPEFFAAGSSATLSGELGEDDGAPVSGREVTFALGSQSCTGTTDSSGSASCTLTSVNQPVGPATASADFAGDTFYLGSSDQEDVTVFAPSVGGGAFAIGDLSATGRVTFWSSQWSTVNVLSGGPAPSQFKGFTLGSATCGQAWNTGPGNSPPPPPSVPSHMAVIVTSKVKRNPKTITGDTLRVVVVETDPGYGPDPSQTGTGTVVGSIC